MGIHSVLLLTAGSAECCCTEATAGGSDVLTDEPRGVISGEGGGRGCDVDRCGGEQ